MPIPNRASNGSLHCVHGTFADHCGVCVAEFVASLEQQLEAERARVKVLREAMKAAQERLHMHRDLVGNILKDALAATAPEGEP